MSGKEKVVARIEATEPIKRNINDSSASETTDVNPDVAKYESGTAYTFDAGLTNNVVNLVETPEQYLKRSLVDDEVILDTFDVKFPGEFVPLWKIVTLCIITCGLYLIVLAFRAIRRCCYRNRCCTPAEVHFVFGKMCITNKGRMLCWKEEVYQYKPPQKHYSGSIFFLYLDWIFAQVIWLVAKIFIYFCCKDLCAPTIEYAYDIESRSYRIADIKQITQYMTSEASCIWCCLDYEAGVEISFNQFNHGSNHLQIASRSWFSPDNFGEEAQTAASSSTKSNYYSWAETIYGSARNIVGQVERAAGIAANLNTLFIYSNTGDRVHNGDVDGILKDVNNIHKRIINVLPAMKDAVVEQPIDSSKFKIKSQGDVPGLNVFNDMCNKYSFSNKFKNVTIVGNDTTITIPEDWMPLVKDEKIISTIGEVPRMTCCQWFWSIVSFGYYYICLYRRRKYTRSALVLTNKRLISVDIFERSGTVPLTLSNFSIQVRSYILDSINSGFINSQSRNHFECGVECDAGAIFINFSGNGRNALPFAHALQMSTRRIKSKINDDFSKIKISDKELAGYKNYFDLDLIPMIKDEITINVLNGNKIWEACGSGIWASCCNNLRYYISCCGICCWSKTVKHMWSKESCNNECCCKGQGNTPVCFPCLPYILSCALRPFQYETSIIITDMSIIRYAKSGNNGLCGCLRFVGLKCGLCTTNDVITISWQALNEFSGFNVFIRGDGKENVIRRCCRGNLLGSCCCPIGNNSAELNIDFKGNYSYGITKEQLNHAYVKDPELNKNITMLSHLELLLQTSYLAAVDDIEAAIGSPSGKSKSWFNNK